MPRFNLKTSKPMFKLRCSIVNENLLFMVKIHFFVLIESSLFAVRL